MKFGVSSTLQLAVATHAKNPFMEWIKMWPTQFILATLEIKLTKKLEDILTIPEIFVK